MRAMLPHHHGLTLATRPRNRRKPLISARRHHPHDVMTTTLDPTSPNVPTHSAPTSTQTILPAMIAVDALVAAEGNSRLAAERLGVTPQILVASIAQDPSAQESLNAQLRTFTTLHTFDT